MRSAQRDLPWRKSGPPGDRDPYHALVSEAMLQQTQVSRVVVKFAEFMERFPTLADLAAAHVDDVLALWSGMGYYRRARNLHAAARMIVEEFDGVVPRDPAELKKLPGVGAYTAGAIASMAFGVRTPLVDGNVARVLLRIEGKDGAAGEPETMKWAWERAESLVQAADAPGLLNEGLMELGATVCAPPPAEPRCMYCPVGRAGLCEAQRLGIQNTIPRPKAAVVRKDLFCATVVVRDAKGNLFVEQRSEAAGSGTMWAGLWQAPTLERADRPATPRELLRFLAASPAGVFAPSDLGEPAVMPHGTTHRRVEFHVYQLRVPRRSLIGRAGRWLAADDVAQLGLSGAQRKILLTKNTDRFV